MQELIESGLLVVVTILSMGLLLVGQKKSSGMTKKQKVMLWRILIATVLLLGLQTLGAEPFDHLGAAGRWVRLAIHVIDYLIIGYDILKKAFKGICNRQIFDENFLMAVATLGALALAVYENGEYLEVIAVMLFYQVGEWFQSYAVGKSRRNISDLMDIRPDYANVERDGKLEKVDPDEVEIGSVIIVQPGEKVPIDGIIVEGISTLNTAALTGESLPRDAKTGDEVISGCINMTGVLKIQTNKEFGESTVSKILELVENASSRKSKSENFISRFARIYTPAVCYAALALAILPPLIQLVGMGLAPAWETWIYRALTFLVASCPCALVISIPLSFFAGIGGASRAGVLVKGSNYLETLSQVKTIVFDKTGTLTQGVFEVDGIHHNEISDEKLVEYAALAESASSHPISKSLQRAYGKEIDRSRVSDVQEISGNGIIAKVDGVEIAAGNDKLMNRLGVKYTPCHSVGTIIHMAIKREYYAMPPVKSVGNSTTAPRDLVSDDDVKITLYALCESVAARLREQRCLCSTVQLGIRDNTLLRYERQEKLPAPASNSTDLFDAAFHLFCTNRPSRPVRSLSVRACGLSPAEETPQLSLFPEDVKRRKREDLEQTVDRIRAKYGYTGIRRGIQLLDPALDLDAKGSHIIHPIGFLGTLS